jgi:DNA-binding NarL/FixJ family response regulator
MRARIFLADDHSLLLDAFSNLLEPKYDVVGTATDGRIMLNQVSNLKRSFRISSSYSSP